MAELAAAVTANEVKSVKQAAERWGISRASLRRMLEELGIIGGPANQHKDSGFTVRTAPAKRRTKAQLREEGRRRREAKRAIAEAARLRQQLAESDAPDPGSDPGQPPEGSAPPGASDPTDPPKPKRKATDGGRGRPKARLPNAPTISEAVAAARLGAAVAPGSADILGAYALPPDFDEIDRLKKLAVAPWIDASVQLAALRVLVGVRGSKGKIDWTAVTVEQVPEEMRHRLAGMLLPWIDFAELPEVVRVAPPACRQVYKLTGVLPQRVEDAEAVLERWMVVRQELRDLAGEVRAPQASVAEPLDLALAAETAYTKPQWEEGAN